MLWVVVTARPARERSGSVIRLKGRIPMKRHLFLLGLCALLVPVAACSGATAAVATPTPQGGEDQEAPSRPGSRGGSDDEGMKPYAEVITEDAVTDEGLFDVHTLDEKLFFEVPVDMLGREILLLTRIAKTPANAGWGGGKSNTSVVRWERQRDRLLLRLVSHVNVADTALPIADAVASSNFEPVVRAFDIAAMSDDSSAAVVDVTSLFTADVGILGLQSRRRTQYGVRRVDADRTFVTWSKSFPRNVEVRRVLTYDATSAPSNAASNTISMEMNHSMLLLPDEPMQARRCDDRVGYFSQRNITYGPEEQRSMPRCLVSRWRLEPSDAAAFARGELVDPVKPIVYYIDPATPEEWRPYLKQGVEDWQVAFEDAGFSNAILAMDPPSPEEDPDWSPEDARYSVIRYLASPIPNASGPHVHDPRTGEILESDIQWYHNVMTLLRNWFFVQTAAVNPDARGVDFSEEVMGELIRFVSAHEVGHTLGLQHNMASSDAYPVDSLRTRFTCRMGVAPSIMDYARFNYVAQPGDDVCLMPAIGPYDKWAIEWGYRPILGETTDSERATLNQWVVDRADDPLYRFSSPTGADPTALTEAIGDDAVAASDLGVENLKRTVANLTDWTFQEGEDYTHVQALYGQIVGQWNRYAGHVLTNIGGVVHTRKAQGQDGPAYAMVSEGQQRASMDYLGRQVFATPEWILDSDILDLIQGSGAPDQVRGRQVFALNGLLNVNRMKRLVEQEAFNGNAAYTLGEMLDDLRATVWSEVSSGAATDAYRRNLQRAYVDRIKELMEDEAAQATDIAPFVRGQLRALDAELASARSAGHRATQLHYDDIRARITKILDPNGG